MNTSIMLIALASALGTSADVETPAWTNDYSEARQQGQTLQRPLAVVFGSGAAGKAEVCREGKLTAEMQKSLASKFVCVYVDLNTPAGKELASSFSITRDHGLVLSDRTGTKQAFHHDGDLSAADLARSLDRFSDPKLVVTTTVTDLNARISYYPDANGTSPVGTQYFQQFSGSSYCPSCNRR